MRQLALITPLLASLGAAGCAPTPSERLVGKWEYNLLDRAKPTGGQQQGSGGLRETLWGIAEAAGLKVGMQVEFRDDQTVTMSASLFGTKPLEPMEWKVAKVDGDVMTVEIRRPSEQAARNLQITLVDDDHFRLTLPGTEDRSLLFTRVRQE
jgi:hypothetical protein